jgi:hypothetical protein|tara:strand:- start:1105 stop:2385 length:1281 start_codon:yes stop_codon:yes gene_type:complete
MADVKFSELSTLAAAAVAAADVLAIVDTSESASKKLTIDNLFGAVPVNLAVTDATQSSSNTTGSITTTGGIGVVKNAFVGGGLSVFGAADFDGSLDVNGTTNLDVVDIDGAVQIDAAVTVGVDGTGQDVTFYGDTADSNMLWDQSADALEFGNSFITITDARTTGTVDVRGLTIDVSNKVDTGSSNDRIGIDVDVIGDVSGNTIRDAVAIRAVSRQSTGAEVTRLNTPIHAILDMANTASANNVGTTLSGAYGLVIDHDDTIATRTGQPTAFISFGEMYAGGTTSIETSCLFDIFPEGKNGDATFNTAANVAFYTDGAQYSTTRDVMLLCSTDGAPGTDAYDHVMMENDPYDSIQMEDNFMIETEDGEAILLEVQDNVGTSSFILFESGSQDADGVLKIKVNGEYKYLQLYNEPGQGVASGADGGY